MSLRNGLKYQHQRNAEFKRSFQIYALFHRMKTLRLECKDLMRIKCCCLLACKYRVRTSNKSKARACLCERGQKPLSLSHIQLPARINFLDTPRILNRFLDECCGNRCNLYCYSHTACIHRFLFGNGGTIFLPLFLMAAAVMVARGIINLEI